MGTRSLTHVRETENGLDLVCMYRQMDGYCAEHGKDLKEFLTGYSIVNGMTMADSGCEKCGQIQYWHRERNAKHPESVTDHAYIPKRIANGISDLAGRIIAHFKTAMMGDIFMQAPNSDGQAYDYVVWFSGNSYAFDPEGVLMLKVVSRYSDTPLVYNGPLEEFNPMCEREAADAAEVDDEEEE